MIRITIEMTEFRTLSVLWNCVEATIGKPFPELARVHDDYGTDAGKPVSATWT